MEVIGQSPENLGLPLNSSTDDLFYKLSPGGDRAYLISNRPDEQSKSLKAKPVVMIFTLSINEKLVIDLTTIVLDEKKNQLKLQPLS
ncbi:MAG: hypothetical protein IPO16_12875 [Saprospiraceae bacterium]|nr:hypothetical protein [Saprospiraceae bacterium]